MRVTLGAASPTTLGPPPAPSRAHDRVHVRDGPAGEFQKNAPEEKSGTGRGTFPPLSPVLDGVTDYLLHPGGLLPVHDTGTELVALGAWLRRQEEAAARRCACGRPCGSPSARTCGGAGCIAALDS